MPELIAHTEKEYIELSVALATNPELRLDYGGQIKETMACNRQFLDGCG